MIETLFTEEENVVPTEYKKILMAKVNSNLIGKNLEDYLERLNTLTERGNNNSEIMELLKEMVPGYRTNA